MRIVVDARQVTDHFPGIGRYIYNLLDALGRLDHGHELLALHNPGANNTRFDLTRLAEVRLVPIHALPFSLTEQRDVPRVLAALKADLYHAPYYVRPYRTPCPSVTTCYDAIPFRFPDEATPRARLLWRLLHRLATRTSEQLIAISAFARADLAAALGVDAVRFSVVPLAAAAQFAVQPSAAVAALAVRYQLSGRYVACLCSNKPHKNLATLVAAWAHAQPTNVELVIGGPWDARYAAPQTLAERLGVKVRWLGPVAEADVPALLGGAMLFAYPSRYEGFGLPPLEAMACGTPVLCGALASLPEVVGDAAILADVTDATALAGALKAALANPAGLAAAREHGLAQAARFSWERCARETLAVYAAV